MYIHVQGHRIAKKNITIHMYILYNYVNLNIFIYILGPLKVQTLTGMKRLKLVMADKKKTLLNEISYTLSAKDLCQVSYV